MWNCTARSIAVLGITLGLAACSGYGFGPKEFAVTNDTGLGNDAAVGATSGAAGGSATSDDKDRPRGGTTSGAGGSTSASTPAPSGPGEKPDQRGNTPPGVSRDGQGPLGGAIVDPAGAVTKGK